MTDIQYAAFLRGINVGGNKQIKMEELKKAFESLRLQNVKTILNSGNVIFETNESNVEKLTEEIENKLKVAFGHEIYVTLRTKKEIEELVVTDPFKGISITPETRLYVTFLYEEPQTSNTSIDNGFKIVLVNDKVVCSVVTLGPKTGTTDFMKIIEKAYGKKVTTRNWNTIVRITKSF